MKKVRSKLHPTEIGVIKTFSLSPKDEIGEIAVECSGCTYYYNNLAELCEKWEDYEEGEYYYAITSIKADDGITKMKNKHNDMTAFDKSIGNYFETKEEAEKAVEKLKAWKRLKDEGFRFNAWYGGSKNIDWEITSLENEAYIPRQICDDLDLLFGGEE